MIIVWKNDGNPNYAGKELELFRISWSNRAGRWVRNEKGTHWGVEHPAHNWNIPLKKGLEEYGTVIKDLNDPVGVSINELLEHQLDVSVPSLELGRPELNVFDEKEEE